jgi:hypothetical protein
VFAGVGGGAGVLDDVGHGGSVALKGVAKMNNRRA